MKFLKYLASRICENKPIAIILTFIFYIPFTLTLLQYQSSGFISKSSNVNLLYWPGSEKTFSLNIPVLISFGIMGASYVYGVYILNRKSIFIKVVLISMFSLLLGNVLSGIVSSMFNIHEMQNINNMNLNGVIDRAIFAEWYNPLWEEIFFTGIPLLIYKIVYKKLNCRMKKIFCVLYYIVPSVIVCIYHIPNHGYIRIADTFIIHLFSQYIATKFALIASIVMHYFMDAAIVISLSKYPNINHQEIQFLFDNQTTINTVFSISVLLLFIFVIFFILKYSINYYKNSKIERKNVEIKDYY